jgi:diguanylate cyclase (GGDEF)-like protein
MVAGAGNDRDDPVPDLDRDIATVEALVGRYGAALDSADGWRTTRGLVGTARLAGSYGYPAWNVAIEGLQNLIVHVGDESNLTLDPDLDTYYLMDTLQFRLPVLLDMAGRAVERPAVDRAGNGDDVRIELGLDSGVLASTRKTVHRSVATIAAKTADDHLRRSIRTQFDDLDASLARLGDVLNTAVDSRGVSAVPVHAADTVRAQAAAFAAGTARSLDGLLRARIDRFTARAGRVELVAGLAALLGGYLFVGFYLGVVPPIRRIVAGLRAVADGDLSSTVCVDTHDELSFVVRALNDTVARTKVATDRLELAATHDPLTALPNRALVLDRLQQALLRAQRDARRMAVFFIDLDQFKMVNDSLGHEAGDQVLRTVAGRLTQLVRGRDTVARLAGDEFVLIGEDLETVDAALHIAERLVEALSAPIVIELATGDREVTVGTSVGIAFADGTGTASADDLLRDADVAMYRAKQRGRGRVEIFDDTLRIAVERRMQTQSDLRRAIDDDQLVVHYQPIVAARTGEVLGFEALVRWEHPVRGLLGPAEFIDVAEECGMIVPLGAAVLAKACAQIARWRSDAPGCDLHVAVNVSAAQFAHPSFVPTVASVLAETGLDPDALWLEITETSIMADAEAADDTLRSIRALGVHLSIDDFGTGYSSLTYLRRFPVEALKVDRSFVDGLGRDKEDEAIVAMILSLARTLDLHVIAEGVETAAQLDQLDRLGCELVQGYYFARPIPAAEAWSIVRAATTQREIPVA